MRLIKYYLGGRCIKNCVCYPSYPHPNFLGHLRLRSRFQFAGEWRRWWGSVGNSSSSEIWVWLVTYELESCVLLEVIYGEKTYEEWTQFFLCKLLNGIVSNQPLSISSDFSKSYLETMCINEILKICILKPVMIWRFSILIKLRSAIISIKKLCCVRVTRLVK